MKIVATVLIIILIVMSCVLAIRFNQKASDAYKDLEQERFLRMTAEQELQDMEKERDSLNVQLKKTTDTIERLERVNEQTKTFNQDLQKRLEEASQAKEELQLKLRELSNSLGRQEPVAVENKD